jgi:hypothetical protein
MQQDGNTQDLKKKIKKRELPELCFIFEKIRVLNFEIPGNFPLPSTV